MEQASTPNESEQTETTVPSINSTELQEPIVAGGKSQIGSTMILGHNDSANNTSAYRSKNLRVAYPLIVIAGSVAVFVISLLLLRIVTNGLFEPPKSNASMAEAYRSFIGPSIMNLLVGPLVSVFFVRYIFKLLLRTTSFLSVGYSVILNLLIGATTYLFLIGLSSFLPSTYESLAPVGIIYAMLFYGPIYYFTMNALLKNIQKKRFNLSYEDSNEKIYELLEATILLLRRISYVGILGSVLVPFLASSFA